jgi:RNA polymerase sigma factor (sigma-70 family)
MIKILTTDDLGNDNFYPEEPQTVRGDKHCQKTVFDKSDFAFGLPKGAATINPQAKQTKRDSLERLTNEFLGFGGAITICPPGKPPKFRFGAFKPSPGSSGACRSNDLSRRRWYDPLPNRREERDLIRKANSGDERAKQKLVESYHRLVRSIVSQYSGPPHNDLMAAGLFGFCEAISRFNENRGYRLSTYAKHWIRKYVLIAIKDWRKEGAAGETRQDRYVFSNPGATAEQVVAAVGGRLENAEKAIARLDAGHEHFSTTDADYDEDDNPKIRPAASHEMHRLFDAFSYGQPSLKQKTVLGSSSRPGWIDELADYSIKEARLSLIQIGRQQYALELVERDRIRVGYRAKPSRYLYRKGSALKDYARARQTNLPSVADTWAILCREKNDRAQKLKEVAASHKTIQNHDPYKHLRPPKLGVGRKLKSRGERIWHDTRTTIPEKSLPLPCLPMLQARHGLFVKKNFSVSATFVEPHCFAI